MVMRTLADPGRALAEGCAAIRAEFQVPAGFPADVEAAAAAAALRVPDAHRDRTGERFVTLDPASATDLDQAFALEPAGGDLLLHYAIADVGWFVQPGDPLDREAWVRGETLYLPDGKAPLYPPALSEGAASLLPGRDRPALVHAVRVAPDGAVRLEGVERALIRSRAKLAYESATPAELPAGLDEFARRIAAAERARGAARVDPPEQEVALVEGRMTLRFRPRSPLEDWNAALSLAANLAVADALLGAGTGLFRVMAEPDESAVRRLRHSAAAYGLDWPAQRTLTDFERTLDPAEPRQAAMMLAIRRAGRGASYAPFRAGERPWHAAVAATYAQATAPLRRLPDRYVGAAVLAVANGQAVPAELSDTFERLPPVMARSGMRAAQVERAVIALGEAVTLEGREGERFDAVVVATDERGATVQLSAAPVVERIADSAAIPGERIQIVLEDADPARRRLRFRRAA